MFINKKLAAFIEQNIQDVDLDHVLPPRKPMQFSKNEPYIINNNDAFVIIRDDNVIETGYITAGTHRVYNIYSCNESDFAKVIYIISDYERTTLKAPQSDQKENTNFVQQEGPTVILPDSKERNWSHYENYIHQTSGRMNVFGLSIPHGYIYGFFNGSEFIASPVCSTVNGIQILWRKATTTNSINSCPWFNTKGRAIKRYITQAFQAGAISLYDVDKELPILMPNDFKIRLSEKAKNDLRSSAANHQQRKPGRKIPTDRRPAHNGHEYVSASCRWYGYSVEMNRKDFRMTDKMADYMDSHGGYWGADHEFHDRPLQTSYTQFPLKSGKKK